MESNQTPSLACAASPKNFACRALGFPPDHKPGHANFSVETRYTTFAQRVLMPPIPPEVQRAGIKAQAYHRRGCVSCKRTGVRTGVPAEVHLGELTTRTDRTLRSTGTFEKCESKGSPGLASPVEVSEDPIFYGPRLLIPSVVSKMRMGHLGVGRASS